MIKYIPGSTLFLVGQIVSAFLVSLLIPICLLLPSVPRANLIAIWARFNIWTLRWCCGIDFHVTGQEHIPQSPSIIISNHQSAWETLAFQLIFPAQSYILKKELLMIPFFGWGLAVNRPIAINRSEKRRALEKLITDSQERLDEGRWLVVFPEGTRMPADEPGDFQVGGAMMAVKTGASIVPVAHNAGYYWPKQGFIKKPGTVNVVIGPVIDPAGLKPREVNARAEQWIKSALAGISQDD
ncbi:MAG: lysophospholipid acyltransferase family protein [Pseudomonadota bacterium]